MDIDKLCVWEATLSYAPVVYRRCSGSVFARARRYKSQLREG